jgi:hypothetical protein
MLGLERCRQRRLHEWSWSQGGAIAWSAQSLTHGWMRRLESRSVEAMSAHPAEQPRHPHFHQRCSPCFHPSESLLAQKSNLNNNPNLSNGKGDNSKVKYN